MPRPRSGSGWVGKRVGDFWDSIGNVNLKKYLIKEIKKEDSALGKWWVEVMGHVDIRKNILLGVDVKGKDPEVMVLVNVCEVQ